MIGKSIMLVLLATVTIIFISRERESESHAKRFCAYGRVFVEFTEGNKTWGTILLDWDGNPIPCREKTEPVVAPSLNI